MPTTAPKPNWTLNDAPGLDGKTAIVTGATGGIGFETALGLARCGATTIVAGRDRVKGAEAVGRIQRQAPGAKVRFEALDLASLASVARFADTVTAAHRGVIAILVINAGVLGLPPRQQTEDGFERQIGVNYLGHFALTVTVKDALCAEPGGGGVVNDAGLAHRRSRLNWDALQTKHAYDRIAVYGRSKLAILVFSIELQRRVEQN